AARWRRQDRTRFWDDRGPGELPRRSAREGAAAGARAGGREVPGGPGGADVAAKGTLVRPAAALAAVVALLALSPVAALGAEPRASLSEIEAQVMCPVCGTLLQLAESPQAQREKAFIARLISEGKTEGQIKDALVAQYGQEVLALPQGSGFDLSAYLVP